MEGNPIASIASEVIGSVINYGLNKSAIADQNYYNSPVQQMKRMSEAGLNPNLIYGAIQPSTQTSTPDNNIGRGLGQQVIAAKQLQLDAALNEANIDKINADKDLATAQAGFVREQTDQLAQANANMRKLQEYIDKDPDSYYGSQAKKYLIEYLNAKAIKDLNEQQLEINRINQDLHEAEFWQNMEKGQEEIKNIKKDTDLKDKQINNLVTQGKILDKDLENYIARFLTQPTPWFADIIRYIIASKLGLDPNDPSLPKVVDKTIDALQQDTKESKEAAKRKFTAIYKSKYEKHDDKYTYKVITAGPDKGKHIRIEHSSGKVDFID